MTTTRDAVRIPANLVEGFHVIDRRHYDRLLTFVALYFASAAIAVFGAVSQPLGAWTWPALAPIYLVAAASLHGISLFTHEGVHGLLSRNLAWNRALSVLCALPVGQNYAAYRVLHLRHHQHLGEEGDPDHYANYTRWTWLQFAMHWGRLILGYPAYLIAIPLLGWRHGKGAERAWILLEVALFVAVVACALLAPIPGTVLIHGWLIPMLLINTMVNIRGMSQHTLLEHHADPIRGTRSILTNRLTAFFMCNENYHLEHHLYPGVPWYNLPRLHAVLQADLRALGAPYIRSYLAFVREFVAASFRRSPLGRWRSHA